MGSHRGDVGRAQVSLNGRVRTSPRTYLLVLLLTLVGALVALVGVHPATAATREGTDQPERGLEMVSLTVHNPGGLAALFGAPAERTLRLTVRNPSPAPVRAVATARWREGSSSTTPIPSSGVVVIRSGETVAIEMPFELDSMAIGEHTVEGEVTSTRQTLAFAATTTQWPWGLALVAIVLVALLRLGIRALVRRWRRRRADPPFEPMGALQPVVKGALLPGPAHGPVPMLVPDVVIDLREPRVVAEPVSERQVIDLRTTEPEPTPEDACAGEPGSERALIEQVQRLAAELRESARREVESLNLSPSAEERRLSQSRRTTRELAEALVLASKALDDQASEETPPDGPAAPPPHA